MEELQEAREAWSKAFLSGDTEAMRSIESPSFSVLSEKGRVLANERYSFIDSAKSSNSWFKPSAVKAENNVEYVQHGEVCNVSGIGKITAQGNTIRHLTFSELWVKQGTQWRVKSLHMSNIK